MRESFSPSYASEILNEHLFSAIQTSLLWWANFGFDTLVFGLTVRKTWQSRDRARRHDLTYILRRDGAFYFGWEFWKMCLRPRAYEKLCRIMALAYLCVVFSFYVSTNLAFSYSILLKQIINASSSSSSSLFRRATLPRSQRLLQFLWRLGWCSTSAARHYKPIPLLFHQATTNPPS